jgi:hypothetical protein
MATETLVSLQIRFPTVDRAAVADQIAPAVHKAIAAGGAHMTLSIQPYENDDEDDDGGTP